MKKVLFILALVLSITFVGCHSPERNARKQIERRMETAMKTMKTSGMITQEADFKINDCIYSNDNDSLFIFSGELTDSPYVKEKTEFLFQQYKDKFFVGLKFVESSGSLLRNINKKANTGNPMDDIVNQAFEESGLGLSMTIYNDLQNGSLIDITDIAEN